MDDDGTFTLYEQHVNFNNSAPYVCAGLNFSTIDASNINLNVAYVYDAMYAAAYGLHDVLYSQRLPKATAALVKYALINNVGPYQGVSGTIEFSNGRSSRSHYGIGDRIAGYDFNIINFNPALFTTVAGSTGFNTVGTCGSDGITTFTATPIYSSANGGIPSDRPPDIQVILLASIKNTLNGFGYALIALTVVSMLYCYFIRKTNVIRIAQPMLLSWSFIGCLMVACSIPVISSSISTTNCQARVYLFHISYYLVTGSITAKLYRLHLLCNVSSFKKVDVSEDTVYTYFRNGLFAFFIYLVIMASIFQETVGTVFTTATDGVRSVIPACMNSGPAMEYALLVGELALLFFAGGLCLATMNAPDRVNETGINFKGIL